MAVTITLRDPCRCGYTRGFADGSKIVCVDCNAKRGTLSETTQRFIAGVTELFGQLKEPVILRKPNALQKIKEQDRYLQMKFTLDGRTWFGIISDIADGMHVDETDVGLADPEKETEAS